MKLTPKLKRFADEFLIDLNATQAAIRAGYSKKTAHQIGYENLKKPDVAEYISEAQKKRAERTEISQDRVLKEYARLAFLDPRKFYDENGHLKSVIDLDDDTAACLAGMEVIAKRNGDDEPDQLSKIKFTDKKGALDSVARHLGMFGKDNEQRNQLLILRPPDINKPDDAGV